MNSPNNPRMKLPLVCNVYIDQRNTRRCVDSHKDFNCCRRHWSAILRVVAGSNPAPIVNVTSSMSSVIVANEHLTDTAFVYEAEISNKCCVTTDTIHVVDAKNQTGNCTLTIIRDSTDITTTCEKLPPKKVPLVCNVYTNGRNTRRCVDSHKDSNCCRRHWSTIIKVVAGSNPAPIVNVTSSMSSAIVANEHLTDTAFVYEAEISNKCCVTTDTIHVVDAKNQTGKCMLSIIPDSTNITTTCKKLPPKKVPLVCNVYIDQRSTRRCVDSHKDFNCCRRYWSAILRVVAGSNPAPIVNVTSSMSSAIVANEYLTDTAFVYEAEISNKCCVTTDTIHVVDAKNQTGNCTLTIIRDSTDITTTCEKLPPKKVPLVCNVYTNSRNTRRCVDSHKDSNCCRRHWSTIIKVVAGSNPAPIVNVTSSMSSAIVANEHLTDTAFVYEAEISNKCCVTTDTIHVVDAKNQIGKCSLTIIRDSVNITTTCQLVEREYQSHNKQPNLLHNTVTILVCLLLMSVFYQI